MKTAQVIGGVVVVGGLLWWMMGMKTKLPSIPALPPMNTTYPIPAETSQYANPPASQVVSQPSTALGDACPNVSTPEQYNALAGKFGLPAFTGSVPTNSPDDPQTQAFNSLVSQMKTMAGCFAPADQDSTITDMPSNWAEQSVSYK